MSHDRNEYEKFHFLILGAGFGGCLTAWLLQKLGFACVVVDRQVHPRFALGESSTPIADSVLRELGQTFGLDDIIPLSTYGSAKRAYPELGIGLKRGFSYFHQVPNQAYEPHSSGANQLLVAASVSNELSDTHWYRADIDRWFFEHAVDAGATVYQGTTVEQLDSSPTWKAAARQHDGKQSSGKSLRLQAEFLIDATGASSLLARHLQLKPITSELHTQSHAIFGHFRNWPKWGEHLSKYPAGQAEHPFPCDDAALHHLIEEGWIWQLAFDNGITSVGIALDSEYRMGNGASLSSESRSLSAKQRWEQILSRYPSLAPAIQHAKPVLPAPAFRSTDRLQFLYPQTAGPNWAMLPSAAGFIDPLHSTGIAHTLWCIRRLISAISECQQATRFQAEAWQEHWPKLSQQTVREFRWLDQLINAAYRTRHDFQAFVSAIKMYFTAVVRFENQRAVNRADSFMDADNPSLKQLGHDATQFLRNPIQMGEKRIAAWQDLVTQTCLPYDQAGLFAPGSANMFHHTASPEKR